jgi:hypothetical protein
MKNFDEDAAHELVQQVKLLECALLGYAQVLTHSTYHDPIAEMYPILGQAEHVRQRLEEYIGG